MTRFKRNPRLEAQLERSVAYQAALLRSAAVAKVAADRFARAAGAPWMPRPSAQTIEVDHDGDTVRIVNTDYAGHLQEFGSANNPPHAPLRRAVRAAGLRLEEQ